MSSAEVRVPSIQLRALIQDSVIPVEAERPLMV